MKLGVSLPMLNQPMQRYAELAALADQVGFDSVWNYEFYRNPFTVHAVSATATKEVALGTGIATVLSRSPFEMANAALDVDELSGGRMLLGVATGGVGWAYVWNGADISHPLSRIREYIEILRLVWNYYSNGEPVRFNGRFYRFESPVMNPVGPRAHMARPQIPIFVGALQPRMLQLAGEIAEGQLSYLTTPSFVLERIRPNLAAGAVKAGRDPRDVEVAALVLCSVSDDRDEAIRRARINVGTYTAAGIAAPVVDFMGMQEEREYLYARLAKDGFDALPTAAPDALVETFSIAGPPDEVREKLRSYQGVVDHLILHCPYVPPIDGASSQDAFRSMVRAFGREEHA